MPTVRNQETQQFMEIIDANKQLISKVCLMYARDHEHFKDLYQEVMATLWQGMKSFSGESKISTWNIVLRSTPASLIIAVTIVPILL